MIDTTRHSVQIMVFSACFYGFCSGMMNIVNKALLDSWSFHHPEVMMTLQLAVTIFILKSLKFFKKIELVDYGKNAAASCALLSFFYSTNTFFALYALTGMNLPMYTAVRRCVPMTSAIISYFVLSKRPCMLVTSSVGLITIGAVVAALGDVDFNRSSYILGCISIILMASYLVTVEYTGIKDNMKSTDLLYINSCNCFPILFLLSIGSYNSILLYPHFGNPAFYLSLIAVCANGGLLNYSLFLCTTVNSALTTTCVGVIKSAFVTAIGMFIFGGATPSHLFILGISINFFGGVIYTYAKFKEKRKGAPTLQSDDKA